MYIIKQDQENFDRGQYFLTHNDIDSEIKPGYCDIFKITFCLFNSLKLIGYRKGGKYEKCIRINRNNNLTNWLYII